MGVASAFCYERKGSLQRLSLHELVAAAADPVLNLTAEEIGVISSWLDMILTQPLSPEDLGSPSTRAVFEHQTQAMGELALRVLVAAAAQNEQLIRASALGEQA